MTTRRGGMARVCGREAQGGGIYVYSQQKLSQYCKAILLLFFVCFSEKDRWVVSLSVRATEMGEVGGRGEALDWLFACKR